LRRNKAKTEAKRVKAKTNHELPKPRPGLEAKA